MSLKKIVSTTVGQKLIMAVTGIALVGFLVGHLAGNLLLLLPDGSLFNEYAFRLEQLGWLLYVVEAGLAALFLIHIVTAMKVTMANKGARPIGYEKTKTKGGPSKSGFGSKYMIVTGIILAIFLVLHIFHFKLGETEILFVDGHEMRDLHALVIEEFNEPLDTAFYIFVMSLLFFHLRHGFWSLFQSLGLAYPKYSDAIYRFGLFVAIAIAGGFIFIPVFIFCGGPDWLGGVLGW